MDYENRRAIEEIYKWDLTSRYQSNLAWEKDYKKLKREIGKILKFKGQLLTSTDILFDALETYFSIANNILRLYVYANSKFDEDLGNTQCGSLLDRAMALHAQFNENASFLEPEILEGNKATLNKLIKAKRLVKYRFYLTDLIRNKAHTLNEQEEVIVHKLTEGLESFEKINSILTNSTLNYGEVEIDGVKTQITNSNYRLIMTNPNREVRKKCYELYTNKLKEFASVFASSLTAYMKTANNLANIRKFNSLLEMDLFTSNIPLAVYNNLFKTVEKRLDVYQKYFQMIKNASGLERLEYYDIRTELVDSDLTFTVEDARLVIEKSLAILGENYLKLIGKAFDERWIDFGSYKGKAAGAYATCNYGNNPLILTNYRGKFTDISTLVHELGHAVNFSLSMEKNHPHDYWGGLFLAEVASLTNEVLLSHYIITSAKDKNLKLTAIYNLLDTIQNNLFDACIEQKLEHEMYKQFDAHEEISVDLLNETIYQIRQNYYGNSVALDDHVKYFWARRSHYFRPYYLFKYATGISAAIYIAKKIINKEDDMQEKYLTFLTKGDTNYPIELLKEINVDMTKPKVINEAIDYMDYLINEFNKISEEN